MKISLDQFIGRMNSHLELANSDIDLIRIGCLWYGYTAALLEWGLISHHDYKKCIDLLPEVDGDQTNFIFTGP